MINGRLLGTMHYPTGDAGIHDGEVDGAGSDSRPHTRPSSTTNPQRFSSRARVTNDTLEMVVQDANGHGRVTARRKT